MQSRPTERIFWEPLARQLGQDAFDKAKEQASEVIAWEKLRREKSNQSEIMELKARYDCLFRNRTELLETLRRAPSGDRTRLLHQRWYYRAFALTLILAGIFFAHLALAPFGLGWEAWVLCVGIGWVAAFWVEMTLEKVNCEYLLKTICVLALLASLGGIFVMALLRGDILALYLKSVVETTGDPNAAGSNFYADAIWKLQLFMALLAIAMELGSGMALFETGTLSLDAYVGAAQAKRELREVEEEMRGIIGRVTHLANDPAINEAEFWRNFYLGILDRAKRNGLAHFPIFILALALGPNSSATAQTLANTSPATIAENDLVIALDLTQSVAGKGYDGTSGYEKNVEAACHLITQLRPGARFTVLGITDRSFSQPYVLLQRELPTDRGPLQFQDRIAIAKIQAVSQFRSVVSSSPHSFPHTDIFGALILAADILGRSPRRKALIIFSDMRQSTRGFDLERPKTVSQAQAIAAVEKQGLVAQLQGVNVYVLGVDGAGYSLPYWNSLRDFWESYFRKAAASLKQYSALRNLSVTNRD